MIYQNNDFSLIDFGRARTNMKYDHSNQSIHTVLNWSLIASANARCGARIDHQKAITWGAGQ